jgi:hypothetical protein
MGKQHGKKQLYPESCILHGFRYFPAMPFGVRPGASGAREIHRHYRNPGEPDRHDTRRERAGKANLFDLVHHTLRFTPDGSRYRAAVVSPSIGSPSCRKPGAR